jgi:hypothetical protein
MMNVLSNHIPLGAVTSQGLASVGVDLYRSQMREARLR